jgi:hypothetical protein
MLHSRRKAEIEILTAAAQVESVDCQNSQGSKGLQTSIRTTSFCSASDGDKSSEPHALLLLYLASKIDYFVKSASNQSSQKVLLFP